MVLFIHKCHFWTFIKCSQNVTEVVSNYFSQEVIRETWIHYYWSSADKHCIRQAGGTNKKNWVKALVWNKAGSVLSSRDVNQLADIEVVLLEQKSNSFILYLMTLEVSVRFVPVLVVPSVFVHDFFALSQIFIEAQIAPTSALEPRSERIACRPKKRCSGVASPSFRWADKCEQM